MKLKIPIWVKKYFYTIWRRSDIEEDDEEMSEARNEKPVDSTVPPALPTPPASNLSTLPVSAVPVTTVPATTVPATTVPVTTVPASTLPAATVPGTTVPATTVPATTVPVQYPKLGRLEEQAHLEEEISLVKETKVICSLDILLELFKYCRHPGCTNEASFKHHTIGPTLIANWNCPSGHQGRFSSSKDVNAMYANNLQVAAAILLSGNSFFKIEKMARFMGLSLFSDATFFRMQRLYLIPVVNEWWSWQREQILKEFFDKEVIVCGDGQCDSPGHTAKNLCYFLMELVRGYIVEVEVNDKRHVNLVSVNMEKNALRSALQRLRGILNVVEIVTDASSTIKKLIGKILQAIIKQVYQYCFTDTLEFCSLF